jgi:hypothetical protein
MWFPEDLEDTPFKFNPCFNLKKSKLPLKPSASSTKGPSNLDVLILPTRLHLKQI